VQALIKLYWDICLFRRGPQDVPASGVLLVLLLVVTVVFDVIHLNLLVSESRNLGFGNSVLLSVAVEAARLAVVLAVLWLLGLAARTIQTLSAMLGAELLIAVIGLPFDYMAMQVPQDSNPFIMLSFMLLLWSWIVDVNILRQAMSRSFFVAAILVLGQLLVAQQIISVMAPLPVK
jgi:hypothetical protein